MAGPIVAVHDALIVKIRALATAAGERVFGQKQMTAPGYPYVMVWPGVVTPIDEECFDRTEIASQIDVWADTVAYIKVKMIADEIRTALHEQEMEITGHVLDRMRIESILFPDPAPNHRAIITVITETQPIS